MRLFPCKSKKEHDVRVFNAVYPSTWRVRGTLVNNGDNWGYLLCRL